MSESPEAGLFGKPPFMCCLYGDSMSGKSVVIRQTCHAYKRFFSEIIVVTATKFNGGYDFLPDRAVHTEFEDKLIDELLERQRKHKEAGREVHSLLIFDDCVGLVDFRSPKKHPSLQKLWISGRHYNISTMLSLQTPNAAPPIVRENVFYATFHRPIGPAIEALYKSYCPGNMNRKEFKDFLHESTRDYAFILMNKKQADPDQRFTVCKIPPSFVNHKFKLVF